MGGCQSHNGKYENMPSINKGLPLIGDLDFIKDLGALVGGHKGVSQTVLFGKKFVFLHTNEYDDLLYRGENKTVDSKIAAATVSKLFGRQSVIALSGKPHKKVRNAIQPAFQRSVVQSKHAVMEVIMQKYLQKWGEQGTVDIVKELYMLSLENAFAFVGIDTTKYSEEQLNKLAHCCEILMAAFYAVPINLGKLTVFGRALIARQYILDLMKTAINDRREKLAASGDRAPPNDPLQKLLEAKDEDGQPLDMDALTENMLTIIVGGTDTTSSAYQSIMLNMCRHPEYQDKVYDEVREVLGTESLELKGESQLTLEQWNELTYVDQITKECERVNPPTCNSSLREAICDFDMGPYRIEKGTVVIVENINRTKDSELWDVPDKFDPERFNPESKDRKVPKSRMFGGGTKTCPGKGFTIFEQKVMTTLLLRDYKISLATDEEPACVYSPTLKMENFRVKFERR